VRKTKPKPDNTLDTILQAGQLVNGNYRVDHLLGEGGMAAVWAGTNERTGKRVALKVILRSLATTRAAQHLFHSEALAASRVNHPNVVTVFDIIEHEGMACIVMELLDGEPLGSYITRKGFLSVSEAVALLLPAMRGVAAAHAQGVIHRDLKPQNIFICVGPDGRVVTTKVLDFGISVMMERAMDAAEGPVAGLAMGTPAYMSPEHILGVGRIDQRADVYGFGILLYEALTGQMPFPGEPGPDLFHRILNEPAPRVTLFRPDLPPGLVKIIETAMAKEPDHRYADLNLMVLALEGEEVAATPLPRLLTPLAGVTAFAPREPLSDQAEPVVQIVARKEPSGAHQETMLYCARSPEGQGEEGAPATGAKTETDIAFHSAAAGRATVVLDARLSLLKVPLSGLRGFFARRGRLALLGAGLAVALVLGVGMGMQSARHMQAHKSQARHLKSPASEFVTAPAAFLATPATPDVPAAVLAPLPASPVPPAEETVALGGHNSSKRHAYAAYIAARRSRVAVREPWREASPHRAARAAATGETPLTLSPPPMDRAAAKSDVLLHAGRLSEDDF